MTTNDNSGEFWLSLGWGRLRSTLTTVLVRHSHIVTGPLLEHEFLSGRPTIDDDWSHYVQVVSTYLNSRRKAVKTDTAEMIGMAISLLGEAEILRTYLIDRWGKLAEDRKLEFDPVVEFRRVANVAVRDMRKRFFVASPAHLQTWSRLDRISRELSRPARLAIVRPGARCSMTHFREVLAYCREHFPNDRSLPRTIETLSEYFYENCADCFDPFPEDSEDGALADTSEYSDILTAEEIMLLPDFEGRMARLIECLGALEPMQRKVIEMAYGLDENGPYSSVTAFCAGRKISRRSFYETRSEAYVKLETCVLALRL